MDNLKYQGKNAYLNPINVLIKNTNQYYDSKSIDNPGYKKLLEFIDKHSESGTLEKKDANFINVATCKYHKFLQTEINEIYNIYKTIIYHSYLANEKLKDKTNIDEYGNEYGNENNENNEELQYKKKRTFPIRSIPFPFAEISNTFYAVPFYEINIENEIETNNDNTWNIKKTFGDKYLNQILKEVCLLICKQYTSINEMSIGVFIREINGKDLCIKLMFPSIHANLNARYRIQSIINDCFKNKKVTIFQPKYNEIGLSGFYLEDKSWELYGTYNYDEYDEYDDDEDDEDEDEDEDEKNNKNNNKKNYSLKKCHYTDLMFVNNENLNFTKLFSLKQKNNCKKRNKVKEINDDYEIIENNTEYKVTDNYWTEKDEQERNSLLIKFNGNSINSYNPSYIDLMLDFLPASFWEDESKYRELIRNFSVENEKYIILKYHSYKKSPFYQSFEEIWKSYNVAENINLEYYFRYVLNYYDYGVNLRNKCKEKIEFENKYNNFLAYRLREMYNKGYGNINNENNAEIIYYLTIGNFYTCRINKTLVYYKFINPSTYHGKGEIGKWIRMQMVPKEVPLTIVKKMELLYKKVLKLIDVEANAEMCIDVNDFNANTNKNKTNYTFLINNIKKNQLKLGNTTNQNQIIKQLEIKYDNNLITQLMDSDNQVLGVLNGVLDLDLKSDNPQPSLCENYPKYYVSKRTNANFIPFDPNNEYIQKWFEIFNDIFLEDDVREYIWFRSSTCIDGDIQVMDTLQGVAGGCNGKSAFCDNLLYVLGNYGSKLNINLFTKGTQSGSADPDLMQLWGVRGGFVAETNKNDELNSSRLKTVTEKFKTGRKLYNDNETFSAAVTSFIFSNYPLRITENDYGTWRRLSYYKFKRVFVENPDPNDENEKPINVAYATLAENNQNAADALLSILVHYRVRLQKEYNGDFSKVRCETIETETKNFQKDQDTISNFISQNIVVLQGHKLGQKDIRPGMEEEVKNFYEEHGIEISPLTITDIAEKYKKWYKEKINTSYNESINTIETEFENSKIGKYFRDDNNIQKKIYGVRLLNFNQEKLDGEIHVL